MTEVRVRLEPPDLGSVRIRLGAGEKTLSGEIAVSNQEVKGIVESQIQQLRSSLTNQGLDVGRIDVSVRDGLEGEPPPRPGRKLEGSKRRFGWETELLPEWKPGMGGPG